MNKIYVKNRAIYIFSIGKSLIRNLLDKYPVFIRNFMCASIVFQEDYFDFLMSIKKTQWTETIRFMT